MDSPAGTDGGLDDDGRVIDRSGDIDQRPSEERSGVQPANAISFRPQRLPSLPASLPAAPLQRFQPPPAGLADMAQRLQKDLDKQYARAKSQLETLSQKISAQEKRCIPPKLDGDLQQIRFQRQKVLIANGPFLAGRLREERNRLADLEHFKAANRLVRDAHYPESPVLGLGIVFVLILAEAGINGVLFADSSDQGLFGGWLEALVLSITNVGAAFLFGRIILTQLHRPQALLKIAALAPAGAGLAALIAINLFGAHYRDFKAAAAVSDPPPRVLPKLENGTALPGPKFRSSGSPVKATKPPAAEPIIARDQTEKVKEREAIKKVFEAPFTFDSFMSFFLFVTGLCGATIASIDGYKFDDPLPGFGKRHRRCSEAREQSAEALRRILSQSNVIMTGSFKAIGQKLDTFAQEMASLLALHHAYAGEYKDLKDSLEETVRDAEGQLAAHERLIAKVRDPEMRDLYAFAVKQLPALNEKQIKFYEVQDKKLKALQKSAHNEQSDVLGVFDAATADFQQLLAEASQASLEAALGPALAGATGKHP
jgi:hypothetical protein